MNRVPLAVVLVSAGCVTGTSPAPTGDTSTVAELALQVVEVTPAMGSLHVMPLDEVVVMFDRAVEPASLAAASIEWTLDGESLPWTARLAGARTLVVDPEVALPLGSHSEVSITGLRGVEGSTAPHPPVHISFTTHQTPRVVYVSRYRELSGWTGEEHVYNERGALWLLRQHAPGPDGVIRTTDDETTSMYLYDPSADAPSYVRWRLYGPGDDGLWNTKDDLVSCRKTVVDDEGTVRSQVDLTCGEDGEWNTDDDEEQYRELTRRGATVQQLSARQPGEDGVWFTDDDIGPLGEETTVTPGRRVVTSHSGPGPDQVWFTDDDSLWKRTVEQLDELGRPVVVTGFVGPGEDLVWSTKDDVVLWVDTWAYDRFDRWEQVLTTRDDGSVTKVDAATYDLDGLFRNRTLRLGPGKDGVWDNKDDDVGLVQVFSYDGRGFPVAREAFTASGMTRTEYLPSQLSSSAFGGPWP